MTNRGLCRTVPNTDMRLSVPSGLQSKRKQGPSQSVNSSSSSRRGPLQFGGLTCPLPSSSPDLPSLADQHAVVVLCCAVPCCLLLQLKKLHKLDLSQLHFVGESLTALRKEVGNTAAVLGEYLG